MKYLKVLKLGLLGLLSLLLAMPQSLSAEDGHRPMVISVGWSSPDTRYLKQHIGKWEKRPFTGTTVLASWPQQQAGSVLAEGNDPDSLSWSAFQEKRFTPEMLQGSTEDLRQTAFTRKHDNFLWVVSSLRQGHFDWFDDQRWLRLDLQ